MFSPNHEYTYDVFIISKSKAEPKRIMRYAKQEKVSDRIFITEDNRLTSVENNNNMIIWFPNDFMAQKLAARLVSANVHFSYEECTFNDQYQPVEVKDVEYS